MTGTKLEDWELPLSVLKDTAYLSKNIKKQNTWQGILMSTAVMLLGVGACFVPYSFIHVDCVDFLFLVYCSLFNFDRYFSTRVLSWFTSCSDLHLVPPCHQLPDFGFYIYHFLCLLFFGWFLGVLTFSAKQPVSSTHNNSLNHNKNTTKLALSRNGVIVTVTTVSFFYWDKSDLKRKKKNTKTVNISSKTE